MSVDFFACNCQVVPGFGGIFSFGYNSTSSGRLGQNAVTVGDLSQLARFTDVLSSRFGYGPSLSYVP